MANTLNATQLRKTAKFFNFDRASLPFLNIKNRSLDFNGEMWFVVWDDGYVKISNNTSVVFPTGVANVYIHVNRKTGAVELLTPAQHKDLNTTFTHVYVGFFHLDLQEADFPIQKSHKRISFLGDSIWSFSGHIPQENSAFYPANAKNQLTKVSEMNFHKIGTALGSVCVNNSFSGSRISTTHQLSSPLELNDTIKAFQTIGGVATQETKLTVIDAMSPVTKVVDTIVTGAPVINSASTVDLKVTGCGSPTATVTVTFKDGKTATGIVDAKGNWSVDVPYTPTTAQPGINTINRISKIVKNDGTKPEVVIISQGINDYTNNVKLHISDLAINVEKERSFEGAYRRIVSEIQTLCPEATIVMTSLGRFNFWSGTQNYTIPNGNGNTPEQFNAVIEQIANEFGCIYVNFYDNTGISKHNFNTYYVDLVHPNRKGQQMYANKIINTLREDF